MFDVSGRMAQIRKLSWPSNTELTLAAIRRRRLSAELEMTFRLDGDIPRIQIPPIGVPRFARDLWRHTCFETFIAVDGQPTYHEFNFAPSRAWAVYAFSGYRNGGPGR